MYIWFVNFNLQEKNLLSFLKSVVNMNRNDFRKTNRFSPAVHFKEIMNKIKKVKENRPEKSHITKQLMHSFEVNIRICQPSKVVFTSASPRWTSLSRVDKSWWLRLGEHHFLGLTNPDVNLKRMHQCIMFCNFKQYCTVEIWFCSKFNFLKINIKTGFSIVFSAMIDV